MDSLEFDEAVKAALSEAPEVDALDEEEKEEGQVDQADSLDGEQTEQSVAPDNAEATEAPEQAEEELFEDLVPEVPASQSLEAQTFVLPGIDKPVGLAELKDGYLRQANYTQGKQALAEERRLNERAIKFWTAFENDPTGVARSIAEASGLIEKGATPAVQVDLAPLRSQAQIDAEVNRRVAEAVANHPEVQKAALSNTRTWITSEFTRIETERGVKLGPKSRQAMLRLGSEKGITDLGVVYDVLQAERARKQAGVENLKQAAPAKRTARITTQEVETEADSFEEAARRAAMEVAS